MERIDSNTSPGISVLSTWGLSGIKTSVFVQLAKRTKKRNTNTKRRALKDFKGHHSLW